MKLALTAFLTLAATGLAAPLASAQSIDYAQRAERADGYYPQVLRGEKKGDELLGKSKSEGTRFGNSKIVHVRPQSGEKTGIRVFKSGKVTTVQKKAERRPIKPIVHPRENRAAIVPVKPQKHRKGTVLVYTPDAFRAVPDQGKSN